MFKGYFFKFQAKNVFVIAGVCHMGFLFIHFTITGMKHIVRYTGLFAIYGFVISGFQCNGQ